MVLELTAEQKAFQQQVEQFAREIVAQRAAGIDKAGEFPADVMHAAAEQGLLGVTIPKAWGGLGRDYGELHDERKSKEWVRLCFNRPASQ